MVTGSGGSDLLVSPRFEEIYRAHGLTGLEGFEPVEIVHVRSPAAAPGQVLVSSTAKDLVAGSGLEFRERGTLS